MAPDLNVFRVCGDLSHFLSILILIWSFRVNRSAEGELATASPFHQTIPPVPIHPQRTS